MMSSAPSTEELMVVVVPFIFLFGSLPPLRSSYPYARGFGSFF